MRFDILTIFPEMFAPYLGVGVLGRAMKTRVLDIRIQNIRDFADDKHKTVDDTPYGGGAGMVLKIEPIAKAIGSINDQCPAFAKPACRTGRATAGKPMTNVQKRRTIVLSARGKQFTQARAEEYAKLDSITLICGRYEGVDQRVADYLADEEISIGPYVLNGGEVAAMAVIEAVSRLIPGVLGNQESLKEESFSPASSTPGVSSSTPGVFPAGVTVEYPQYTKPEVYKGWQVPDVLLSGNHDEIRRWREQHSKRIIEE